MLVVPRIQHKIFVMVLKALNLKKKLSLNSSGVTLAEMLAVVAVIILISGVVSIFLAPQKMQARTRDNKRISDMSVLERAIVEYMIDNANYPDEVNVVRYSNTLPTGNLGPVENAVDGWVNVNFSAYLTKLPIDPVNDVNYRYAYIHDAHSFEINSVLEDQIDYMSLDGGNNDNIYELGNNLTLLD